MVNVPKVLIVDDEETIVRLLSISLLSQRKFTIIKALDGLDAVKRAKEELPDVILMGVMMPKMDGFAACRAIKEDPKTSEIPIIFVTGKKSIEDHINGYTLGADHYIAKPWNPKLLYHQILNSLNRRDNKIYCEIKHFKKTPKVFISYKWEDDDHNNWVMNFASDLRRAGIEAFLDQWEVRYGDSFTDYMTSKISEADVVLFIMTTRSVAAVEEIPRKGGAVKFEMQLAASRKISGEKFRIIPIYREGGKTASYVRDNRYADFRDNSKYQENIQLLINDIFEDSPIAPPLGKPHPRQGQGM